jgi:sugar phosphate permease
MGLVENLPIFWVCRFFQGFFMGIIMVVSQNRIIEYMPIRMRSFMLSLASMGNPFGGFMIALSFRILMSDLDPEEIMTTMCIFSIFIYLIFVYKFIFCHSSPRHLILDGKDEEAFDILEKLNGDIITESDRIKILEQVRHGANSHHPRASLFEVFKEDYLRTTIFLCLIFTIIGMAYNGPILFSTFTINKLGEEEDDTETKVIMHQITMMALILPMQPIGGLLSEFPLLGRKLIMVIGLTMCLMFILLCCIFPSKFSYFLGLSLSFIYIPFTISAIYAAEIFNTRIRDQAVGLLCLFRYLGALLAHLCFFFINRISLFMPYYFTLLLLAVAAVFSFFLPYETYGKPLDQDMTTVPVFPNKDKDETRKMERENSMDREKLI